MSLITDAIKQISILAEKRNTANVPGELLSCYEPYPTCRSVYPNELSQEQVQLISERYSPKPRLSLDEIENITETYRFRLPQEFYDLYKLGNGCLPLGISAQKDWDSVYNYFNFPNRENHLWHLSSSIDAYCNQLIECNPELLPFCTYGEEATLYIVGGEEPKENSPLVFTYDDCLDDDLSNMEVVWPSLTNMMLAYAEWFDSLCKGNYTENRKREIYQHYSNGTDTGWYRFR